MPKWEIAEILVNTERYEKNFGQSEFITKFVVIAYTPTGKKELGRVEMKPGYKGPWPWDEWICKLLADGWEPMEINLSVNPNKVIFKRQVRE